MAGSHRLPPILNIPIWFYHHREVRFGYISIIRHQSECTPCWNRLSDNEYLSLFLSSAAQNAILLLNQRWWIELYLKWKTFSVNFHWFPFCTLNIEVMMSVFTSYAVTVIVLMVKMIINLQTRRWSFGSWLVMRLNMAFHRNACTAILISSATLFYHPMVTTLCPVHGTRLYVCGIWLQEKQLADSKIIPRCEEVLLILYFVKHTLDVLSDLTVPKYSQKGVWAKV